MALVRSNPKGSIRRMATGEWNLVSEWDYRGASGFRETQQRSSVTSDKHRVRAFAKKYGIDISREFDLMTKAEQEAATR